MKGKKVAIFIAFELIKIPNLRWTKCFVKAPREHSTIAISRTMSGSAIQQCKAGQGGARELHKRRRGAEDLQSISRRVRASFPGESKFSSCRAWASVDSLVHIFASVDWALSCDTGWAWSKFREKNLHARSIYRNFSSLFPSHGHGKLTDSHLSGIFLSLWYLLINVWTFIRLIAIPMISLIVRISAIFFLSSLHF